MTTLTNGASSRNHSTYITLFESRNTPKGTRQPIDWSHWFNTLISKAPSVYEKKTEIPGWSAATFIDDHRNNKNVELISALVLDIDDSGSLEDAHYAFREYFGFIHTSYSHGSTEKEGKPCPPRRCFRIILPLARPVTPDEYQQLWLWAQHHAKQHHIELDPAPKAPGQFWYQPALQPGHEHLYKALQLQSTQLLNPDLLLSQAPQTQLPSPNPTTPSLEYQLERARKLLAESKPSIQGQHGSKALLNVAIALRRGFELPPDQCTQLILEHFNPRCDPPWKKKDVEKKVADADTKSSKPWGYLSREKIASERVFAASPSEIHERRNTQRRQQGERRTPDPWIFHTTDTGNAERLATRHGQNLRYCHPWNKWLLWNGKKWQIDVSAKIRKYAKETAQSIYAEAAAIGKTPLCRHKGEEELQKRRTELASWARKTESRDRREAMIVLAQTEDNIPVLPDELDSDPWLLNIKNGTLDLRTGELYLHQRTPMHTKIAGFHFDPKATCPTFEGFLYDIFQRDEELIRFVWKAIGYSLTGETSEQCFFLCHGNGENGKTTFFDVLRKLIGEYGKNVGFSTFAAQDKVYTGQARPDLIELREMRLITAAEPDQQIRLSESLIKILTGEDPVTARNLYESEQTFTPCLKLWLMANHKPIVRESNHGFWRRVRLIPFEWIVPTERKDKKLKQKLLSELSGIANKALEACRAWQQEELSTPHAVTRATADYRGEMDRVGVFLNAKCIIDGQTNTTAAAKFLYEAYSTWSSENGEQALTQSTFGTRLGERGIRKGMSNGRTVYRGVKLKT